MIDCKKDMEAEALLLTEDAQVILIVSCGHLTIINLQPSYVLSAIISRKRKKPTERGKSCMITLSNYVPALYNDCLNLAAAKKTKQNKSTSGTDDKSLSIQLSWPA